MGEVSAVGRPRRFCVRFSAAEFGDQRHLLGRGRGSSGGKMLAGSSSSHLALFSGRRGPKGTLLVPVLLVVVNIVYEEYFDTVSEFYWVDPRFYEIDGCCGNGGDHGRGSKVLLANRSLDHGLSPHYSPDRNRCKWRGSIRPSLDSVIVRQFGTGNRWRCVSNISADKAVRSIQGQ